ncbi:MAG: 50S ribosomal protein L6 [Candidatus Latescibacterota bacterium]|nr:MAG: 50S ribosomal protein L6 [Candidatus Latescibacterota bacterium]
MSRIGKLPVAIPAGVQVEVQGRAVTVNGPKGAQSFDVHKDVKIEVGDGTVVVTRPTDSQQHRSLHGLTRTLIANSILGVTKGFERSLEINGVGYRAQLQGKVLQLFLGLAHPVNYEIPEGIQVEVAGNRVNVRGIDKKLVGEVAAKIRSFRPPEPYNAKGVKYVEEVIRRKAGKATA